MRNQLRLAEEDRFLSMAQQMSRWMDHVLGQGFHHYRRDDAWRPAVNLCEDDRQYCMVADLAGVDPAQIDLRAEKGMLILTGQRPVPQSSQHVGEMRLHLMEIDHGRFYRAVELPQGADVEAIEASYRNGLLWVRIPKTV